MVEEKKSVLGHLVEKRVVKLEDANKVRVEQSKTGRSEEEVLLSLGVVQEVDIVRAKSEIFNIPFVKLEDLQIPKELLSSVDVQSLQSLKAIPFEQTATNIKVAMLNPFDVQASQSLRVKLQTKLPLQTYITTTDSLESVFDKLRGEAVSSEVSQALEDVGVDVADLDNEETDSLSNRDLGNAPVARIVNSILQYGIKSGASDIHIEPMEDRLRVRYRVDGVLTERLSLPKHTGSPVIARVKILSRLKIDEKRIPQDGRIQIKSEGKKVDLRVSTMPTIYDEKVVMRLLDISAGVPQLEDSGLRGKAFEDFVESIKATNGIILITGPTGSGKTRTLSAALGRVNKPEVNIITLENPVEIRIPGVTQVHINPDTGLTFALGLRAVLRQDPDIVMVGEIRDEETAELAVEASLTGHLVLSTLHTNSSSAAIARLIEMGVEKYLLPATLRCIVAQRLPRRICKNCIEPYVAPVEVFQDIQKVLSSIKGFDIYKYVEAYCNAKDPDGNPPITKCPAVDEQGNKSIYLYKGKGCDRCGDTGYSGRVAVFEVLVVTEDMGPMILKDSLAIEYEKKAMDNGMIKMVQDGYLRVLEGVTTLDEVMRVTME